MPLRHEISSRIAEVRRVWVKVKSILDDRVGATKNFVFPTFSPAKLSIFNQS